MHIDKDLFAVHVALTVNSDTAPKNERLQRNHVNKLISCRYCQQSELVLSHSSCRVHGNAEGRLLLLERARASSDLVEYYLQACW
jgi:hypothetical protein